jgi:hypothetical protein
MLDTERRPTRTDVILPDPVVERAMIQANQQPT